MKKLLVSFLFFTIPSYSMLRMVRRVCRDRYSIGRRFFNSFTEAQNIVSMLCRTGSPESDVLWQSLIGCAKTPEELRRILEKNQRVRRAVEEGAKSELRNMGQRFQK